MVTEREPPIPNIQVRALTSQARPQSATSSVRDGALPNSSENPIQDRIYYGSYHRRKVKHRSGISIPSTTSTPASSRRPSPRTSISQIHLQDLLRDVETEQDSYGLEELRDGFFDGQFPGNIVSSRRGSEYASQDDDRKDSSPFGQWILNPWRNFNSFIWNVTRTRAGVRLAKSFLSFFVAYIICLIPASRDFLGRYNYLMVVSVLLNHSSRTIGAQIDGFFLTVMGAAVGLGWGSLALYVSTSTDPARAGYGGVLAAFLVPFTAFITFMRSTFVRFYQAVISAGIAISYTCLADTSQKVAWHVIFEFGIPWVLGQAIGMVVCVVVFPDAGSRPFAVSIHKAMKTLQEALTLPRHESRQMRRDLVWTITDLSQAVRDLTIDISITRFRPNDARALRNLLQGAIRSILAITPETKLFEFQRPENIPDSAQSPSPVSLMIGQSLAGPTRALIDATVSMVSSCEAALMDIAGHRKYRGPSKDVSADVSAALRDLTESMHAFDVADNALLRDPRLPEVYSNHPEVVQLLLFVHPVRMAAGRIESLALKVSDMVGSPLRIHLPSYPILQALNRSNAQVRHDRGGMGAGFYFQNKWELQRTMNDLQSRPYVPLRQRSLDRGKMTGHLDDMNRIDEKHDPNDTGDMLTDNQTFRYRIWQVLHYLQGFEGRFALKMVIATTSMSVPAWLPQSRGWFISDESWWAVVMVWLLMDPRMGGNLQDLVTRLLTALIGAVWAGFAYAADDGNPYVMAVFAAVFMIPMIYRFTQSTHPRSGIAGCMSFTVVSLSAYTENTGGQIFHFTWTRACAFLAGIAVTVVVNWILWPFIARHEVRKALSTMMLHLSIVYRGVVARYIYYLETDPPASKDIERSEMLEGRLREAFIRIRQILDLAGHEIRLRGPFNPAPYSALIETCELFFEDLVQIRSSSLYFQPQMHRGHGRGAQAETMNEILLSYRRDAVASVLMNLYILAGALKTGRPVPKYMPSALVARKRLLDKMAELEMEAEMGRFAGSPSEQDISHQQEQGHERQRDRGSDLRRRNTIVKGRRWANVYQYAFNAALTDVVERLEDLQQITKSIVGERGFDS